MSTFANFYLLSISDFDTYRKMAGLILFDPQHMRVESRGHIVSEKEWRSPELRETLEHRDVLRNYLQQHGKKPLEYQGSGYDLDDLIELLKEHWEINLTERTYMNADEIWYVFDEATKQKYLAKLNPSNFNKDEIRAAYIAAREQAEDAAIKHNADLMTKEEFERFQLMLQATRQKASKTFPDKIQAIIDGISILYRYLALVENNSVVILNVD